MVDPPASPLLFQTVPLLAMAWCADGTGARVRGGRVRCVTFPWPVNAVSDWALRLAYASLLICAGST
jgi:hypothetical protein